MITANAPPRHYTGEEIALAKDTDMPELLSSPGYRVRRVGSYYTTAEMDSLRIRNRRTWFRYSESTGGDAIDFLRHFHNMSFSEAVGFLLEFNGFSGCPPLPPPRPRAKPPPAEKPAFALPERNYDNQRARTYLLGRGVAPGVIDRFIRDKLLYEDARRHDCVFVGYGRDGKAAFAARRSTDDGRPFKGDVRGSDKKTGFRLPCGPALDEVCVFESPIDLMSWFSLRGPPVSNAIALCGLYDGPLGTYLEENSHLRRIVLCLDADGPGMAAAAKLQNKYAILNYQTAVRLPPSGKDWNEYLQMKGGP